MSDVLVQFRAALAARGILLPVEIIADGRIHRCDAEGKGGKGDAAYLLHLDGVPAGGFENHRDGFGWENWRADIGRRLTPSEEAAQREKIEAARRIRDDEDKRRKAEARNKASTLWNESQQCESHPYLALKGLSSAHGARLHSNKLLIPMRDEVGTLHSLQFIDGDSNKRFLSGGRVRGCYYSIGKPDGVLCVCEGYATGASIYEATGFAVAVAFDAGNLLPVAKAMRAKFTDLKIILAADDDWQTKGNPGLTKAKEAAQAVGGLLAVPDFGPDRPEGATDLNDLHATSGLDAVKRSIEAAKLVGDIELPGNKADWPEPNPLAMSITPEEYPLDALPTKIRNAVTEFAQHVKAPLPLVASSALATVSLVVQAHIDARRDETLENPVSLYMLTIADSGERKSTCDKHFMRVITEYDREQVELCKPQVEAYRADLEAWEAERSGIKARIQKASNEGKDTSKYKNDLRMLERDKPQPPKVPHLVYSDTTPEALARDLATRWPVGGIMSSEAGLVLGAHAMNSESIMRNLSQLNVLWDGGSLEVSRKSTESFIVRDVRLTIGLMVQEPTLREFYGKSGKLTRGTGFFARFFVSWPDSTQGTRLYKEPPTGWPARDIFNRRLSDMLRQPIPVNEEGTLVPAMAGLSPQAKEFWTNFYNSIERELGIGGELRDVRDVASKTADNAVRLAAIFQFFEDGSLVIGLDAIEAGCRLAAWHLNEAQRFFGEIAIPNELAELVNLDAWLVDYAKRRGVSTFSTTEIMQNVTPTKFRKAAQLQNGLSLLEAENRLRFEKDGKKKLVHINPVLLGEK